MTERAAIAGTYYNLRPIVGRKVCQVLVEIPIEKMGEFVRAFGSPNPDTWIALARLQLEEKEDSQQPRPSPSPKEAHKTGGARGKSWLELAPSQQAGLLCNDPAFINFLHKTLPAECWSIAEMPETNAANFVRTHCQVASRADLNTDEVAKARWNALVSNYRDFMRGNPV